MSRLTIYVSTDMLVELQDASDILDRGKSWLLQKAWEEFRTKLPLKKVQSIAEKTTEGPKIT